MMLAEITQTPVTDLPLPEFREHLRLSTGFSDDDLQDPILEASLRGALAAIEARTGKVLFSRGFRWSVPAWRSPDVQALPVAPVQSIDSLATVTRHGDSTLIDPVSYYLEQDFQRPLLKAESACLPHVPTGGMAEVSFTAGFAPDWAGLPGDLKQAVMLLAAHFYETRHEDPGHDGNMPFGVTGLIETYRTVRVLGGAVA